MLNIEALFIKMIILFAIIVIGYIATKAKVLTTDGKKQISALLALLTNPLQIVASVMSGKWPIENIDVLKLTIIAVCIYIVLIFSAKLIPKIFRANKKQGDVYEYLFIFSNVSFIGFPVVEALLGPEYTFYCSIFSLAFQFFCYTYGTSLLSGEKMKFSYKLLLRPCIIAAIIAYIIYFFRIETPDVIYQICKSVGSLTSTLAMLVVGCSLASMKIKEVFNKWQIYVLSFIKLVIIPVIGFYILRFFIEDQIILGVVVVVLGMPAATNATFLSVQYGADEKVASSGVFVTTLMSMITIPVIMSILFR